MRKQTLAPKQPSVHVNLTQDMLDLLRELARIERRSIAATASILIEEALAVRAGKAPPKNKAPARLLGGHRRGVRV